MKKQFEMVGMLVMVLALGFLFAACVQEVTGTVETTNHKVSAVSRVEVTKVNNYIILRWEAVADADEYALYYQQEGKKTIGSVPSSNGDAQNQYAYSLLTGYQESNDDVDKWSAQISTSSIPPRLSGKKVRLGVRADAPDEFKLLRYYLV